MHTKFLETKMITSIKDQSIGQENVKNNDISKLIEDEKKRELLMDIKKDLDFYL